VESVPSIANPVGLQVGTITVGQHPSDQDVIVED